MTKGRDFSRDMLRMCGGYVERARRAPTDYESERALMMAIVCLAWSIYQEPPETLPLFAATRRAA